MKMKTEQRGPQPIPERFQDAEWDMIERSFL